MPVEKRSFSFHCGLRSLLSLVVTPGHGKLADIAAALVQRLRARLKGAQGCVLLAAAAAQNSDDLLRLADAKKQVSLVRPPRRPSYLAAGKRIPDDAWLRLEEPGPFTATVRTLVIREQSRRRPEKDRWHALWVFGDDHTPAYDLVQRYRQRQHHEQRHRILLHDAFVDAAPSGYDKRSLPHSRRFRPAALALYAWIAGFRRLMGGWC